MATKTTYTKNADGTITSRFDETPDAPNPTTQAPIQPAQPQQTVSPNGTTYTKNADGTITSRFADTSTPQQPTQPAQPQQPAQPITDWKNLNDAQKTNENLAKLVENRYNTRAEQLPDGVSANVGDTRYSWYLDEGKNPIRTNGAKNTNANQQTDAQGRPLYGPNGERYVYGNDGTVRTILPDGSQKAPAGLTFDRNSSWNALDPKDKTIDNLQKLIEARYGTLAEVEGDRVVADIGGKMYQWTLDQNGNPVKTEVPADNTQFNSGEILEQLKANPSLDLSSYDQTEANIAKNNYSKIQSVNSMNSNQLSVAMNDGTVLPGTVVRENLTPTQKQTYDYLSTLQLINAQTVDPLLLKQNVETNAEKSATVVSIALEDNWLSGEEVKGIVYDPQMIQDEKELKELGDKLSEVQTEYKWLEESIEEELKGQNATTSYRDRYLAKEGKALYKMMDSLTNTYKTRLGAFNDKLDRAYQLLNTNIQLYQRAEDQAREDRQRLEDRQWNIAESNRQMAMNYLNTLDERAYKEQRYDYEMAKELEQAQKKMDLQLQYEYGDLNSDNPMLVQQAIRRSIQGMYDTYSSLVPGLENPEISYEKVMQKIANGMSPAQALQERHDEIKNSKRLQNALANEQNKLNYDNWKMQQDMNPSTTGYSGYSPSYGTSGVSGGLTRNGVGGYTSSSGRSYTLNNDGSYSDGTGITIPAGAMVSEGYNVNRQGGQQYSPLKETYVENENTGYACGNFAKLRSGAKLTLGDINNRRLLFTDPEAKAGGMVFFDKGYDKTYGHVAYVKAVDEANGKMLIEETNIKGNNEYRQRWVPISSAYGFYNQTPAVYESYKMSELTPNQSQSGQSSSGTQAQVQNFVSWNPAVSEGLFNYSLNQSSVPKDIVEAYYGGNKKAFLDDYNIYTAQKSALENAGASVWDALANDVVMRGLQLSILMNGSRRSDQDDKFAIDIVKRNPNATIEQYITYLTGMNIQGGKENWDKAVELYRKGKLYGGYDKNTDTLAKQVQQAVNKGDETAFNSYLLGQLDLRVQQIDQNATPTYVYADKKHEYEKLIDLIEKNPDKVGFVQKFFNDVKSKQWSNPEYAEINYYLQNLSGLDTNRLMGGNLTESEQARISTYLPTFTDTNPENLLTALKLGYKNMDNRYRNGMKSVGIIREDLDELLKSYIEENPYDDYKSTSGTSSTSSSGDTRSSVIGNSGKEYYLKKF